LPPDETGTNEAVRRAPTTSEIAFKIAVVTSSQNCAAALKAAHLDAFFKGRVDGNKIRAQGLAGKAAPDTFLTAAKLLGAEQKRTVVIKDATSRVQAWRARRMPRNFGSESDVVVNDLGELVA
jgi:beta-phosphoglucomutase-like phosphatase (HAD superfamily)